MLVTCASILVPSQQLSGKEHCLLQEVVRYFSCRNLLFCKIDLKLKVELDLTELREICSFLLVLKPKIFSFLETPTNLWTRESSIIFC